MGTKGSSGKVRDDVNKRYVKRSGRRGGATGEG